MIRLALIGKNIQHSKSPEVYKEIISHPFQYDLIDIENIEDLPSIEQLRRDYQGVNITAPYKNFYFNDVIPSLSAQKTGAINCIKFEGNKALGENTDFLALQKLIDENIVEYSICKVVLLGDGTMSKMVQLILNQKKIFFEVFSRRRNSNFSSLDFSKVSDKKTLIINTCSREYDFPSPVSSEMIFWNLNYSQEKIESKFKSKGTYIDGYSLLKIQAEYAVEFWSIIN